MLKSSSYVTFRGCVDVAKKCDPDWIVLENVDNIGAPGDADEEQEDESISFKSGCF
jgi:hypothetical protein